MKSCLLCTLAAAAFAFGPSAAHASITKSDAASIEQITGLNGTYSAKEDVFKVSLPRTDVKVRVDGWSLPPFMGLTSWAAFTTNHGRRAMTMGDIVLFQDEVNPAMSAALESGLAVTALHNHFFFDEPKVYFMHIDGAGEVNNLAIGVRNVFDKIKEIRSKNAQPTGGFMGPAIPEQSSISSQLLQEILGVNGQISGGMFKAVWGRTTAMHWMSAGGEMGVNTWAAFAGQDDNAVMDGDFAMLEHELQPVLRAMRKEGIDIVALHSHMAGEKPRILFLHYWAQGKAEDLARALRRTLDAQRSASTPHGH